MAGGADGSREVNVREVLAAIPASVYHDHGASKAELLDAVRRAGRSQAQMQMPDDVVVVNAEVQVVQYVAADGQMGHTTWYSGEVPLSQIVGLLVMAAINLGKRA